MGAGLIYLRQIQRHDQHFLAIGAGPDQDLAGSAGHEALTPKLNAFAREFLVSDSVWSRQVASIRNGVASARYRFRMASCCRSPSWAFSEGCQPMAVG